LEGTPEMKAQWAKNRIEAYQGSLMHFLRSVYTDNVLKEGFISNQLYIKGRALMADPRPMRTDTIVTVIDSSFISLKFTSIYVVYNPAKAADIRARGVDTTKNKAIWSNTMDSMGSVLNLYLPKAVVDRKGSVTDYRTFLLQGYWGRRRIGDQLPVEYQPPLVTE
jgi:hypothetical protein